MTDNYAALPIMPSGVFLARVESIGSSADEMKDLRENRLTAARHAEIRCCMKLLADHLYVLEPWGRC